MTDRDTKPLKLNTHIPPLSLSKSLKVIILSRRLAASSAKCYFPLNMNGRYVVIMWWERDMVRKTQITHLNLNECSVFPLHHSCHLLFYPFSHDVYPITTIILFIMILCLCVYPLCLMLNIPFVTVSSSLSLCLSLSQNLSSLL